MTNLCHLFNVTVNGGVTVTSTGRLELERSTVNGGVVVEPGVDRGGELDAGLTRPLLCPPCPKTGLPNTINGGLDITLPSDVDLINVTVHGKVSVNGSSNRHAGPTMCQSHFDAVKLSNVTNPIFLFGDPGEPFGLGTPPDCPGNTLNGDLFVENSRNVEIEGNTISGSVHISNSVVEFAGNSFASAHCDDVTQFTDGDGGIADCAR